MAASFGAFRAPHKVQWLSDNGSTFTVHKTLDIACALNLLPCFAPVEIPLRGSPAFIV